MDDATAEFYARNAKDVVARYEAAASSIARYFGVAFAAGSRVLDVGAGSGGTNWFRQSRRMGEGEKLEERS